MVPDRCEEADDLVRFDCAWPEGAIFVAGSRGSGVLDISGTACEPTCLVGLPRGYYAAPYERFYNPPYFDLGMPPESVCVPSECVFETPGEPARCSAECSELVGGYYRTTFRVDRSACAEGSGVDAGTLLTMPGGC